MRFQVALSSIIVLLTHQVLLASSSSSSTSIPPIFAVDVEGSLHGISRATGSILWSTPLNNPTQDSSPLMSTTGALTFIPPITGSIHLPRNEIIEGDVRVHNEVVYDSVNVKDLVERAPFVDGQGRVFAGSKVRGVQ